MWDREYRCLYRHSMQGWEGGHYNALDNGPLEKFIAKVLYRSVFYTFIASAHLIHQGGRIKLIAIFERDTLLPIRQINFEKSSSLAACMRKNHIDLQNYFFFSKICKYLSFASKKKPPQRKFEIKKLLLFRPPKWANFDLVKRRRNIFLEFLFIFS